MTPITQIRPNLLKGGFGEAHMERHLSAYLRRGERWLPLSARLGTQGLDGLRIRYDSAGHPIDLMISEAKYGTSRLAMTADGIQMSPRWRSVRLARMATEYRSISEAIRSGRMAVAGPGGSVGRQRLQVPLADGRKVAVFARSRPGDPWEFVGPRALMAEAGKQTGLVGEYLQLASAGRAPYESVIYRITPGRDGLDVTIKDASGLGRIPSESGLPVRKAITIPLTVARETQLRAMVREEVARLIRQADPRMTEVDVEEYSHQIARSTREFRELFSGSPRSLGSAIARNGLLAGFVGAGLDVATQAGWQFYETGHVDWRPVMTSGGIAFAGTAMGSGLGQVAVVLIIRNPIAYRFMERTSLALGLGSTGLAINGVGGAVGGGFAAVFVAYGGWIAGLYDARTAHRMAAAGGASAIAATAFGMGMFSLASAMGTASTGTTIASLGGAAATNATLAWLGGGSLAAGGFGVLGGTVVLTGGAALVAIGTGSAVYACFRYFDERQDAERIRLTIEDLRSREVFAITGIGTQRFETHTIQQP